MSNADRAPWNRRYNPPRQHRWTREYYLAALAIIAIALISWTVAAEVPTDSKQACAGNTAAFLNATGGVTQPGSADNIDKRMRKKLAYAAHAYQSPHNSTGDIRYHTRKTEGALHE